MPDPRPIDDLDATRFGAPDSTGGDPEATVADPYATMLPSSAETAPAGSVFAEPIHANVDPDATVFTGPEGSVLAGPIHADVDPDATALTDPEATEFDPYATRADTGTGSALGSSALEGTIAYTGPASPSGMTTGPTASRFHPVRLHARGGLGEVYVAVDGELNREVALKEIQERHGGQPESQLRFVFEAEITGGLEHPGIVPVYGLGRYADGRPYYAMRFIRGDSLKAAIEKFQKSPEVKSSVSLRHSLALHQLLARFVSVCHAIDYAHSRGVLHRDIKPDNVMLGGHGETLVVDWGLAKALNRPDPPDDSHPKPLRPISGNDTSATMVGSVMGTPSFMSPEQAAGEVETLGPASDIFSLGSTLYALLCGKAPFREMPILELLEKVKKAEFPPPRATNKAIPAALEAICLKAMALRPADRYPTAAALAADIERWIADEPVEAYPEPWNIRLGRWARRHRTAVAASFVLLATGATALGISTVLISREKARTEKNYQIARSAVEQMLTRVGEVDLADVPQLETVRRDLLDRALAFYSEFLRDRGRDASARLEAGRAMARLGDIRELLGQYIQAEKNYRDALAILAASPGSVDNRRALARARVNLGILLKKSTRYVEAERYLREGLQDRKAIAAEPLADEDDARSLTQARYQLGTVLARMKERSKEDEALYLEAIQEQETLASKPAASVEDRRELARYLNNLGILQNGSRRDLAQATFVKALAIQDALEPQSATSAAYRWQRARTWNNLAVLYSGLGRQADAETYLNKSRQAFEALKADFPRVPDYRRELAITLNNLAQIVQMLPASPVKPLDLYNQALEDQRVLVADFPEVPDHKLKLSLTCLHLGDLLLKAEPARSEAWYTEAILLQEKLTLDFPEVPEYQAALGRSLTERALLLSKEDRLTDAADLLAPAIAALEKAWNGNRRDATYEKFLTEALTRRAALLAKLDRPTDLAIQAEGLIKLAPDRPSYLILAATFYAKCFEMAGTDASLKEQYAGAAIKALRDAMARGANDPAILDQEDIKLLKSRPDFQKLREDWLARGRKATA